MKIEIKKFEKIDICILSTYGHCGLDWVTSLLDNHEEILIMPSFSYFRCFYYIETWNKKFNLSDINIDNKKIVHEFVRLFKEDKRQQNQRRKFLFSTKQFKIFEKSLQNWLDNSKIKNRYRSLFLGIHYAFAKVYNLDLKKKKYYCTSRTCTFLL